MRSPFKKEKQESTNKKRMVGMSDLVALVNEGKSLVKICEETGKHNEWVKARLIIHYGKRIEFKSGRYGGIFLDGQKVSH